MGRKPKGKTQERTRKTDVLANGIGNLEGKSRKGEQGEEYPKFLLESEGTGGQKSTIVTKKENPFSLGKVPERDADR